MRSPDADTAARKYLELSKQEYDVLVDAFSTRSTRTLDNAKSVYEIIFRPYTQPCSVDGVARENFDRAQQIVSLTVKELQTTGRRATEVTESLAEIAAKFQEAWLDNVRDMMEIGLSVANTTKAGVNGVNQSARPVVAGSSSN